MFIYKLIKDFDEEVLKTFIGENANFYLYEWKYLLSKSSPLSWNWAAFFFNWMWLIYRKMYSYFFLLITLDILITISISFVFYTIGFIFEIFGLYIIALIFPIIFNSFIVPILFGTFGNYLYGKFVFNNLIEATSFLRKEDLKVYASLKGGIDKKAIILGIFFFPLYCAFIFFVPFIIGLLISHSTEILELKYKIFFEGIFLYIG